MQPRRCKRYFVRLKFTGYFFHTDGRTGWGTEGAVEFVARAGAEAWAAKNVVGLEYEVVELDVPPPEGINFHNTI